MTKLGTDKIDLLLLDLFDACYVLKKTLEFRDRAEIGRTIFFKTISNLILDFKTNRFIKWDPHPFGAIPIIPAKGGKIFKRDSYLDDDYVLRMGLWQCERVNRRTNFKLTDFQKSKIEERQPDQERKYVLEGYARIYSLLKSSRLNQLTTCRNELLTFKCSNYEENLWLKKLKHILKILNDEFDTYGSPIIDTSERRLQFELINTATVALQIVKKVEMFEDLSNLKADLNESLNSISENMLGQKILNSIKPEDTSERLKELYRRGQIARNITTLTRLICSAFGLQETPALARIDKTREQFLLFDDYITPVYEIAINIGRGLGIRDYKIQAKAVENCVTGKRFIDAIGIIENIYLGKYLKVCSLDQEKVRGNKLSKFSIIEDLSFFEFQG